MANLSIGYDVVAIKDAVKQVQRNIKYLKAKRVQAVATSKDSVRSLSFYEEKLAA